MPKVALTDIKPGLTLARPVMSSSGLVLMQQGAELTETVIQRLVAQGVDAVYVVGDGPGQSKPLDVMRQEVDERFRGHDDDPWMMELKAIVVRQLEANVPADHA